MGVVAQGLFAWAGPITCWSEAREVRQRSELCALERKLHVIGCSRYMLVGQARLVPPGLWVVGPMLECSRRVGGCGSF